MREMPKREIPRDEIARCLRGIRVVLNGENEPPNRDRAKAVIDRLFDRLTARVVTRETHLAELDAIPVRTLNELERAAIVTVGQLVDTPRTKLLLIPNLGPRAIEETDKVLRRYDFALQ